MIGAARQRLVSQCGEGFPGAVQDQPGNDPARGSARSGHQGAATRCRLADHQAERMPCGIPVDAPGNQVAAGTRPRGDVLSGERRARCDNSVMSGSQISNQDVEVHEEA